MTQSPNQKIYTYFNCDQSKYAEPLQSCKSYNVLPVRTSQQHSKVQRQHKRVFLSKCSLLSRKDLNSNKIRSFRNMKNEKNSHKVE